jgi:hypothetical protein
VLRLSVKAADAKGAFINKVPFDKVDIVLHTSKAVRQVRALAQWLKREGMAKEINLQFRE